jgi:tetratricopeptide (TPR) repeat protein
MTPAAGIQHPIGGRSLAARLRILMKTRYLALVIFVFAAWPLLAQTTPPQPGIRIKLQKSAPPPPAQEQSEQTPQPRPTQPAPGQKVDKAAAYYHYAMAHMYEEMVTAYQQTEFVNRAIEEYKLAIANDPGSEYLNAELAELYAKTGRIRDAVLEAQEIIQRDPDNLDARKLLARIYLRSLGDAQAGTQSQDILKRAIEQYEAIVKIEPKDIENHLLLGRLYRLANAMDKAEAEFKTAVQLDPGSEEAVSTLAYLYNDKGDAAKAIATLNSIPEGDRSSKLYSALGYTYEQQKDYKNAVAAYQKAVDLEHDNLDAVRGLAQNLLNDNQLDKALEQYKVVVEADSNDAQSYLRMADIYRRTGRFDEAMDALKKAEVSVPDSLEVPYNMAIIYQAQGRFDDSIQILQDLLKKTEKTDNSYSPGERNNRSVFLERLGSIYRDTNQPALALATFKQMLTLGPEGAARGYQQVIDTYRDQKQWQDATAAAQEAVAKLPNDRNLKLVLAGQLADSGKPNEAITMVRGMLKGTPDDRDIYIALAQINSRLKRWKDAEEALAKAGTLSSKPEDKDYDSFLLASMYERQKKYDEAETLFRQVVAHDPANAVALNYLGYMMADRGVRLDEALGYIKRAVQLDPQNGAYLDSLGWAYFKMGNLELAEANLRRAVERTVNDPTVLDHLGDVYQKTGRLKLAAAQWERALEEWNKTVPTDVDQADVTKVAKKLESAKVKLAKQQGDKKAEAVRPQ